jgi:hypothetical protein
MIALILNHILTSLGKRGIQYLKRDGTVLNTAVPEGLKELGSTSWDLLYNVLRANFDGRLCDWLC